MKTSILRIATEKSSIEWTGRKVTGAHNGTIALREGVLILNDGKLAGGKFSIDTTSIVILDVTDPATNAQFAGHLASDDFFSSDKHPIATFEITSVTEGSGANYEIDGDLTIKGITHPVQFEAIVTEASNLLRASGKIVIDRTLYDMKFRSGNFFKDLGDTLIYNEFELKVQIEANSVNGER